MSSTTSTNRHPLLLAAAGAHVLLAAGHTVRKCKVQLRFSSRYLTFHFKLKGLDQFKHPSVNTLPLALRGAAKTGWYEGSVFFAILGKSLSSPLSLPPCN